MGAAISRLQFLSGDMSGAKIAIRPPWSLPEAAFVEVCSRCGDCLGRCPTRIIKKGRGGFPLIDFTVGECLFCGDCVSACATGALDASLADTWALSAAINEHCLPEKGVECRACADQCEPRAIRFRLRAGGPALPTIETQQCNGCGACVGPCPAGAINMQSFAAQGDSTL